jgi:AcrR family transcriptional regulator
MPRKNGLDRDAVVRTAAELIQREGIQALTLNRLAAELKIQTPSLYNHVDGMPGLMRELARLNARQLAECFVQAAIGKSGPEGVTSLAQAYRAYIKQNPDLYAAGLRSSGTQTEPDGEMRAAEERAVRVVLAVLASLGLSGAEGLHAARALRSAVHGFTTLEIAGGFGISLDLDESFQRLIDSLIAGFGRAEGSRLSDTK